MLERNLGKARSNLPSLEPRGEHYEFSRHKRIEESVDRGRRAIRRLLYFHIHSAPIQIAYGNEVMDASLGELPYRDHPLDGLVVWYFRGDAEGTAAGERRGGDTPPKGPRASDAARRSEGSGMG